MSTKSAPKWLFPFDLLYYSVTISHGKKLFIDKSFILDCYTILC